MKRVLCLGALLLASAGSSGCGVDSAPAMLRDAIATQNELGDVMMRASDESSANALADTKVDALKKKWETIEIRTKVLADMSPEQKKEAVAFQLRYLDELTESFLRIEQEQKRLEDLRLQLFLDEYVKRREEGYTPRFIDADMYKTLVTHSDLFRRAATATSVDALNAELAKAQGVRKTLDDVEMLILDKESELARGRPTIVFVDVNEYRKYLQRATPPDKVFTIRPFIAADVVKKGENGEEATFSNLYRPVERQRPFIDVQLADKPFIKDKDGLNTNPRFIIDSKKLWPGLAKLIEAPRLFRYGELWSENPLFKRASDITAVPGLVSPPKANP